MPLNPLAPVADYPSMLNRIFWFTSAFALAAVWLLRSHIPALDGALSSVDSAVAIKESKLLPVSAGYLLPALAVGVASRVFRLHACISDWLGIRESFDVEVIIREFADQLAMDLAPLGDEPLRRARHTLMRKAFYPYVSGSQPAIDILLVYQALDAWSWFWIGVEATWIGVLTGFGLISSSAYGVGFQTLSAAIGIALVGLPAMRRQCQRYAVAQVRAILADPSRAAIVRMAFGELIGENGRRRSAA
jgi:hypothetical protein